MTLIDDSTSSPHDRPAGDEPVSGRLTVDAHLEIVAGPVAPPIRRPPRRYVVWPGLAGMLAIAALVGAGNWPLFDQTINSRNRGTAGDAAALSMYVQALMLIWSIVSGWLLYRADEESTRVADAVAKNDLAAFLLDAPKRIALTVRLLHLALSLLFIHSFHLYHIDERVSSFEIQGGIGFLVTLTVLFIWDLDDPLHGVLNVGGIPAEWRRLLIRG